MHRMTKVSCLHVTLDMLIGESAKTAVPIKYGCPKRKTTCAARVIYSHPEKLIFSAHRRGEKQSINSKVSIPVHYATGAAVCKREC